MNLVTVPSGGLANRMRAVASGVALAAATGRRPIVVWHPDEGLNARFGDLFLTHSLPFELKEPGNMKYALLYEKPRKKNLFLSLFAGMVDGRERVYQEMDSRLFNKKIEEKVRVTGKDVIIHSGFIFHSIDASLMNSIFHISPAVEARIHEILGGAKPEFALQIRRTDNLQAIEGSPVSAFEKVAEGITAENPDARIFLATDDQTVKRQLKMRLGDSLLMNPEPAARNTTQGMIDAAAELYILASCSHIYGSFWSSFSEVAALMGDARLTVVRDNQ